MLQKDSSIIIGGAEFLKGQAQSPHVGFGAVRNLELLDVPGIAKIQWKTQSLYTPTALPIAIVKDPNFSGTGSRGYYYATEDGNIYNNGTLLGSGYSNVQDLAFFKDYLFITHGSVISLYGPVGSASAQFFGNWQTGLTSTYFKKIVPGQDNIVYITNGNTLAAVSSFVAGAPTVAPTASFSLTALTLPSGVYARTMTELGKYLAIGTQLGSSYADFEYGFGNIYYWDRSSTSFELPLQIQESGINQMLTDGNTLIVQAGVYGNFYRTNTVDFKKITQVQVSATRNATAKFYPNAIGKLANEIISGSSTLSDAFDGYTAHGIWSLKDDVSYIRNTISTGNVGATANLKIGAVLPLSQNGQKYYLIGWSDGSTYGVDEISSTAKYPSYRSYFESQFYEVGTARNPKTYEHMEITLARPLLANQSIRISYRKNLTDTYTIINTLDTTNTASGETSLLIKPLIAKARTLQLKVELSQTSSVTFDKNIELKEIRIS